jgi:hypothetical protein
MLSQNLYADLIDKAINLCRGAERRVIRAFQLIEAFLDCAPQPFDSRLVL